MVYMELWHDGIFFLERLLLFYGKYIVGESQKESKVIWFNRKEMADSRKI